MTIGVNEGGIGVFLFIMFIVFNVIPLAALIWTLITFYCNIKN